MSTSSASNPFRPDGEGTALFVGRQKLFDYLYHQLADPQGNRAALILGREGSGKSAALHRFRQVAEETFIGVPIDLKTVPLQDESAWLTQLALSTMRVLGERDFSLYRLPRPGSSDLETRDWFDERYLPEAFNIIRHRRLIFLLDDGEVLLDAIRRGDLPEDSLTYLSSLLRDHPALGFVLTLDSQHEARLPSFAPLVNPAQTFRLTRLEDGEVAALLREPLGDQVAVEDGAALAVARASGGQPWLVGRFGEALYRRWAAHPGSRSWTAEDVKAVSQPIYAASSSVFRQIWDERSATEQQILTAMTRLVYDAPLTPVDAPAIARWLAENAEPLDLTTVHAALRALEYEDVLETTPGGIRAASGLMQSWLLEHARLGRPTELSPQRRWTLAAVAVLVGLALLLIVLASQSGTSSGPAPGTIPPTLTLLPTPEGQ
ncbi:MAG: hypothetical protein JNM70_11200 [Anaerolineae bacterium]|nr:hypothetical protein [Anaerolineae bacterium]